MMPKIYAAIEAAVAQGMTPQEIAQKLIAQGLPEVVVNNTVKAWLESHGRFQQKTDFKAWVKRYRARALPAVITTVAVGILSSSIILLRPWPTKIMVDSAFGNIPAPAFLSHYSKPSLILVTSAMTIAIFVVGFIVGYLRDYTVLRLGFALNRRIKEESFRHILHLPLYHRERLSKGDYIYRQNILTNSLSDLVLDTTSSIVQSIVMVIGILGIMFWFNAKLTLISVVLIPFLFILVRVYGPKLGKISRELTKNASATSSAITEAIDNAETVQAFTLEDKQVNKANLLWWQNFGFSKRGLFWSRSYRFSNSLLIILATSAVMYFGGTAALNGQMTLGQLLIFMTYMGYLLGPIEGLATEIATRNQKLIDVSRVYEVLSDHEGIETLRQDKQFPMNRGKINFQNITYAYGDTVILDNINLSIESGEKVGLIGPSGSGKSTFLKLLPLFIEPTRGRIMIDGYDIQTVSIKDLRRHIAWISQSPQLFNGTIAENLLDGDVYRQIPMPQMDQAAAAANVQEFTSRMPGGFNSPAGESGNYLSGGQKQRIAIARGLLKNAPIVCMDEPTAALDSKSENYIRDSIAQLIRGKTVMMVTHRRALLSLMDTIYVVDNGAIKNVSEYGGLETYLRKINDLEVQKQTDDETNNKNQAEQLDRQEAMLTQLEAENARLAVGLAAASQQQASNDVTLYISH